MPYFFWDYLQIIILIFIYLSSCRLKITNTFYKSSRFGVTKIFFKIGFLNVVLNSVARTSNTCIWKKQTENSWLKAVLCCYDTIKLVPYGTMYFNANQREIVNKR